MITITKWKEITGDLPDVHDFEKEKTLEGVLTEKRENVGQNESKLFTFEKKGGDKVAVWGSAVLDRLYTLPIGSLIRIEFLGKEKGKKGTFFKNYKIEVDEETMPVKDIADEAEEIFNA